MGQTTSVREKVGRGQGKKATRGRIMVVKPTQSRERGQGENFPLWGLGQRPNCFSGAQFKENSPQRRRQRSVPASNFALPQKRPKAALSTIDAVSRQMGATKWLVFQA